jgi:hypothetical protein
MAIDNITSNRFSGFIRKKPSNDGVQEAVVVAEHKPSIVAEALANLEENIVVNSAIVGGDGSSVLVDDEYAEKRIDRKARKGGRKREADNYKVTERKILDGAKEIGKKAHKIIVNEKAKVEHAKGDYKEVEGQKVVRIQGKGVFSLAGKYLGKKESKKIVINGQEIDLRNSALNDERLRKARASQRPTIEQSKENRVGNIDLVPKIHSGVITEKRNLAGKKIDYEGVHGRISTDGMPVVIGGETITQQDVRMNPNMFYLKRATNIGRIFEDPEQMLNGCLEYFKACEENPLYRAEQSRMSGKKGEAVQEIVYVPVPRPMSTLGLASFLGISLRRIQGYMVSNIDSDITDILVTVIELIRAQQYENAAIGVFKENIVSRMLGLADKQEQTVAAKLEITYEDMNNED